jgi:hypothetical protein
MDVITMRIMDSGTYFYILGSVPVLASAHISGPGSRPDASLGFYSYGRYWRQLAHSFDIIRRYTNVSSHAVIDEAAFDKDILAGDYSSLLPIF